MGFTDTPVTENGLPFLDFQRLVAFARFFTSAWILQRRTIKTLARPWGWIVTIAALACFVVMIHAGVGCFDEMQRWVWVMRPYEPGAGGMRAEGARRRGPGRRDGCFRRATFVGAGFASIVPSERTWYTAYGSRTMYAFYFTRWWREGRCPRSWGGRGRRGERALDHRGGELRRVADAVRGADGALV